MIKYVYGSGKHVVASRGVVHFSVRDFAEQFEKNACNNQWSYSDTILRFDNTFDYAVLAAANPEKLVACWYRPILASRTSTDDYDNIPQTLFRDIHAGRKSLIDEEVLNYVMKEHARVWSPLEQLGACADNNDEDQVR